VIRGATGARAIRSGAGREPSAPAASTRQAAADRSGSRLMTESLPAPSGLAFRDPSAEWLEADGLGGFASGAASGIRTRRYHALLLVSTTPPTGRFALVQDVEAWLETSSGAVALTSHRYAPDVVYPDGASRITGFDAEPWPRWSFTLPDGGMIELDLLVPRDNAAVAMVWRRRSGSGSARLVVRPLLSGRDPNALHHENGAFRFDAEPRDARVTWRPYPGVPAVTAWSNGEYAHAPDWYRRFLYAQERARGLDHVEDLASPGTFTFDLARGEAVLMFAAERAGAGAPIMSSVFSRLDVQRVAHALRVAEHERRASFPSRLHRAADAYVVRRGAGRTIIAGYPWFTDWGRDTFIALRGLCLATGRLDVAESILIEWAGCVSQGMLPNRFPERGDEPEYNAVDASLWYVVAVHEWFEASERAGRAVADRDRERLRDAVLAILDGYSRGTRYGIRMTDDGLLAAGEPGVALTWMDARVHGRPVTPRIGKPVEIQALWLNALHASGRFTERWRDDYVRGRDAFSRRFWNEPAGALYDVIDVDHVPGTVDDCVRPNMLFAVGGLSWSPLDGARARRVVDTAERLLWTPLGIRTLAPGSKNYCPRYDGGVLDRDYAYHQGTAWPWLIGVFVDAWVRVRGGTNEAKQEAAERFVRPICAHLDTAGLGHVSEVADAEPPFTPRGCPFQAWSVGELLRALRLVDSA
jgi:predicted glycogen debranching enzyme